MELRGDDIGGLAVHIASRVSAMAGRGEVLVTGTVRDLVVGSGIVFDDRGRHNLKGVPDEWQVLAVERACAPPVYGVMAPPRCAARFTWSPIAGGAQGTRVPAAAVHGGCSASLVLLVLTPR